MIREYHVPETVPEAVALMERLTGSAVFLAGGTELNSAAAPFEAERVVSLARLGLADIRARETELVLGACCTIQQLLDNPDVPEYIKAAGRHIVNRNVRNAATVGGQLGSNKSCGNLLPVLVALEAVVDLALPGATRTIPVLEYISGERKELITDVRVPATGGGHFVAVGNYTRTANDLSILTAAVSLARDDELVKRPIVAAGGVARHVIRLEAVEKALHGRPLAKREMLEGLVAGNISPIADIRGSVAFKRHMCGVLVARTVLRAYQQGEGQRS